MSNNAESLPLANEPLVSISPDLIRATGQLVVNTDLIQEVLVEDGIPEHLAKSFALDIIPIPKRGITSGAYYHDNYIPLNSPVTYSSRIVLSIPDRAPGPISNFSLWHEFGHLRQHATDNDRRPLYYSAPHLKTTRAIGSLGVASILSYELAAKLTNLPSISDLPKPVEVSLESSGCAASFAAIVPEGFLWLTEPKEWDAHYYAMKRINHKILSWKH